MTSVRCVALRYHTFVAPLPKVRQVTLAALRRMELKVRRGRASENGAAPTIVAAAKDWQAEIEFQRTGPQSTRMRVLTKEGVVLERNTASEILSEVAECLENSPGWVARYADV
jgi:hypothetical protein